MEKITMEQPPKIDLFGAIIIIIAVVMMALGLFGCATQKKAEKYYKKHPVELAKECAEKYPVTEKYLPGDTIINYDTLWGIEYRTDTLKSEPQVITETKTIQVPKIVTKWVRVTDTIVRENTARVAVLGSQIAKLLVDNEAKDVKILAVTDARDKWRKRFFILLGFVVLYTVIKFRSKLGF